MNPKKKSKYEKHIFGYILLFRAVVLGEQQQTGGGLDWTSSQLDQIPKSFSLE